MIGIMDFTVHATTVLKGQVKVTAMAQVVQPSMKQKYDLLPVVTIYLRSIITRHENAIEKAILCCVVEC